MIQRENNFTRRFFQHPVDVEKRFILEKDSYYFAGKTNDSLYLGNIEQPFALYVLDTSLQKFKAKRAFALLLPL